MGFSVNTSSSNIALEKINAAKPDVLVVGLGAPKQEIWVHAMRSVLQVKVALCTGATIDFLAGEKKRAPVWIRRIKMEWLHRALSEPRRLLGRYLYDAWVFPRLLIKEWIRR
jgi:N-acetylglucosaminyldiphosphoundecaprenol N-acetyl-beta-D-mannosaminyltransferase